MAGPASTRSAAPLTSMGCPPQQAQKIMAHLPETADPAAVGQAVQFIGGAGTAGAAAWELIGVLADKFGPTLLDVISAWAQKRAGGNSNSG